MQTFYLGTHKPNWLRCVHVPLFVSYATLRGYKNLPRAVAPWILDSMGFTVLSTYGYWPFTATTYARFARRAYDEIGNLKHIAPRDWMCELFILKKTGLTVTQHQLNTVNSYIELKNLEPDLPFFPVLQGFTKDDYLRCIDLYDKADIDLSSLPIVGVGSICKRQATKECAEILKTLAGFNLKLHAFGLKLEGLKLASDCIISSDSMAWSWGARKQNIKMEHCLHSGNCANCLDFALAWRDRLIKGKSVYDEVYSTNYFYGETREIRSIRI